MRAHDTHIGRRSRVELGDPLLPEPYVTRVLVDEFWLRVLTHGVAHRSKLSLVLDAILLDHIRMELGGYGDARHGRRGVVLFCELRGFGSSLAVLPFFWRLPLNAEYPSPSAPSYQQK